MWEGGGWAGWSGVGGEWDNCNSIINKYIYIYKKNYSTGNIVFVILQELCTLSDGIRFIQVVTVNYINLYSPASTSETNVILYASCNPKI